MSNIPQSGIPLGTAAAGFFLPGNMARRGGRPRHKAPREPNGRSLRSLVDPGSLYLHAHRLIALEQTSVSSFEAQRDLHPIWRELSTLPLKSGERSDAVLATLRLMRSRTNLSYPMGIAFERGLLGWDEPGDDGAAIGLRQDEQEEVRKAVRAQRATHSLRAGIRYAQLHAVVWRGLRKDVASTPTLSAADLKELLASINSGMPAPPSSFFSKLVARNPVSPEAGTDDPEEYQKLRMRAGGRLDAARSLLLARAMELGMGPVLRIEKVITLDEMPEFLKPGRVRTAADLRDEEALRGALKALAEHFGYSGTRRVT
jgi:hypothetical protein